MPFLDMNQPANTSSTDAPAINRRKFLGTSAAAAGALSLASIASASRANPEDKLRVLCIGGHPDDPETGCGGTLARLAAAGHAVTLLYLTRGEAGIPGKSHEDAAAIRTREAEAACRVLNVRPMFFDDLSGIAQIDAATFADEATLEQMRAIVAREDPDVVLAHWPIDSHRDHQFASLLSIHAWMNSDRRAAFYFYEVMTGAQSMAFMPTDLVDISAVQELKWRAAFCHVSQNIQPIYDDFHRLMEGFRGREMGVKAAEAFVRLKAHAGGAFV